ncbi:MAG: FeoB-associated Cys-rich membrane protein [Clostridiales bacterium]|nr:FeoB-associated Cys-rich membrane protein [Clostridiales bacterium]
MLHLVEVYGITVLTIIVLALIIFLAIRKLVRDKKEGIGACGQKCANCPHSAACHHK